MGFRERMKSKKKKFKDKHNSSNRRQGGRFPTIFNKKKIPEGVPFFKCTEGEHLIDVLPWEAGKRMPKDDQGQPVTEEGDFDYVLDVYVHQNVGSMKQPYVCPYENYGEPCPICEYIKGRRLEKEEWSKTRAKRRSIYLIWDRTDAKTEKIGIQIFDAAHFFMEEKLDEIAKLPRGGGYITFSDPDKGKHVAWTRKGSGQENTRYLGHKFIDRDSPIPDKILDKTFSLDTVVKMRPSYEAIENAFYDGKKPNEDADVPDFDDEKKKSKKKKKAKGKSKINDFSSLDKKKKKKKKKKAK